MPLPPDRNEAANDVTPSIKYGFTLALLTSLYVLSIVDRQIVSILAEPIKLEFHLADWEVGMMTGFSFAIIYTIAGFPLARWAERGDRVYVIGTAVFVWSIFTACCGLAQTFAQFLIARVGVGIGEAGCTPPAQSLITDIVPRTRRASALGIYSMGAPVGQFAGMAIGGIVAGVWGWRAAFLFVGAPGAIFAILALMSLPEPRRFTSKEQGAAFAAAPPPFRSTMKFLLGHKAYMLMAIGQGGVAFIAYGLGAFLGSYFLRNHAQRIEELALALHLKPIGFLGMAIGVVAGFGGIIGSVAGGRIADRWARRDLAAYATLPAICVTLGSLFMFAALTVSNFTLAIGCVGLSFAATVGSIGVSHAGSLGLVTPRSRATASALNLFIVNMIGLGLGPLSVGLLSDAFSVRLGLSGGEGLRWAMIAASFVGFMSAACFLAARRRLRTDTLG